MKMESDFDPGFKRNDIRHHELRKGGVRYLFDVGVRPTTFEGNLYICEGGDSSPLTDEHHDLRPREGQLLVRGNKADRRITRAAPFHMGAQCDRTKYIVQEGKLPREGKRAYDFRQFPMSSAKGRGVSRL